MWLLFEVHTCFIDCYLIILNLKLYDRKLLFCAKGCNRPHHSNVVLASFVGQNDSLVKYYVKLIASIMSFNYLPATCKIKLW